MVKGEVVKSGYWIGILAVVGALFGMALNRWAGIQWINAGISTSIGVAVGLFVYEMVKS